MRVLFHLGHPAHYHMYKIVIKNLIGLGHFVKITINTKDILEQLLLADGIDYENIVIGFSCVNGSTDVLGSC